MTRAVECPACGLLQDPGKACRNDECRTDIHELKSSTEGLRFQDLRHHAITELAESQASEATVLAIAGHVSKKMLERYSHVRLKAKRAALDAIGGAVKSDRRVGSGGDLEEQQEGGCERVSSQPTSQTRRKGRTYLRNS